MLGCFITIFIFILLSGCSNEAQASKQENHSFVYNNINDDLLSNDDVNYNENLYDNYYVYYDNVIANDKDDNEINDNYNVDITINITPHESRMAISSINTIVIKPDGSLRGWGLNLFGELGTDAHRPSSIPIQIGTDMDWMQLTMGLHHTMALKDDGSLWTCAY